MANNGHEQKASRLYKYKGCYTTRFSSPTFYLPTSFCGFAGGFTLQLIFPVQCRQPIQSKLIFQNKLNIKIKLSSLTHF